MKERKKGEGKKRAGREGRRKKGSEGGSRNGGREENVSIDAEPAVVWTTKLGMS